MVYDNYNALVTGFGPTERASDAVFSIALYPRWATLFFLKGAGLPDPDKRLNGNGKVVRSIRIENVAILDDPAVLALIDAAVKRSAVEPDEGGGQLIIKSISATQRPRRLAEDPAAKRVSRKRRPGSG